MPFKHVTVFDDEQADEGYHGLVQDVEGGYTRSVVLIVPEGHAWLLPVYELALMTAERAYGMGEEGLGISIVTPEAAPLAALGDAASAAVGERLERARVRVYTSASPRVPAARRVFVGPDGPELEADRVVPCRASRAARCATSRSDEEGFVPVDELSRVSGMAEHVYAAGDATNLPLKHGGLGARQADVAAAGIAAMAGADVTPEPLRPIVRAVLHTGARAALHNGSHRGRPREFRRSSTEPRLACRREGRGGGAWAVPEIARLAHQGASRNGEAAASALGPIQRSVFRPEQVRGKTLMWRLQAPSRLGCMNSPAQDAVDPPTPLFDEGALELDVGDVMTTGVVTVRDDSTLDEAVDAMAAHRIHAVLVVGTRAGTPLGWITTRGLLGLIGMRRSDSGHGGDHRGAKGDRADGEPALGDLRAVVPWSDTAAG